MYGSKLVFGGRLPPAFGPTLDAALAAEGLRVRGRFTHQDGLQPLFRRLREETPPAPAGLAIFEIALPPTGTAVGVHVRGPRSPHWNFRLGRRLSAVFGGFGVVLVNDRLYGNYGLGLFHAGRTVEAGARDACAPLVRLGVPHSVDNRALYNALDEDRNRDTYLRHVERLFENANRIASAPEATGRVDSFLLDGDVDALEQVRFSGDGELPLTRVVFAGASESNFRDALAMAGAHEDDGWRWCAVMGDRTEPVIEDYASYDWATWDLRNLPGYILLERDGALDEVFVRGLTDRLGGAAFAMTLPGNGPLHDVVDGRRQRTLARRGCRGLVVHCRVGPVCFVARGPGGVREETTDRRLTPQVRLASRGRSAETRKMDRPRRRGPGGRRREAVLMESEDCAQVRAAAGVR